MGACLGVKRPDRAGTNPRLMGSNLIDVEANPFGPNSNSARPPMIRAANGRPNSCMTNGNILTANGGPKGAMSKLFRQSSSLSNGRQLPFNPGTPTQNVQKLVDIDDNPMLPFDKPSQGGRLICNRKQQQQQQNIDGTENMTPEQVFKQSIGMNPHEVRSLIALFDYDPRTPEDLQFRKGEHLETTTSLMKDDWWLARSKSTKSIGYVPSNYVAELKSLVAEPWYLGRVGRAEAERRLMAPENKDGAFIIRDSDTTPQQYSLSLKDKQIVKHYRIKQFNAGGFFISKKTVFSTIHDLVLHYTQHEDGLCINLREPCVFRMDRPATFGLSYNTVDHWEVDRSTLTLGKELGRGQFGQVFEGTFRGSVRVAIKTLRKGSMDPLDFLAEAQIMKNMTHDNLVRLYAVCTKEEPVYIITELMTKGALISYLQTDEGGNAPLSRYIEMATQIAAGMAYLEREKYVHRDLAARNILVSENNVCKIADFGLARIIKETEYEARAGARFPIKWTAPEAANFSKFTIKSDVWSFGIVLYEIITKGGIPYPEMSNAEVLSRIDKGYRMPQPPGCESKYYSVMVDCWNKDPLRRPTFDTLHWRLADYFTSDEQYREASQYRDK